jgi:serine/threonine protein kinase
MNQRLSDQFSNWVERLVVHGERLSVEQLSDDPSERQQLERLIADYDALEKTLAGSASRSRSDLETTDALPQFAGFRTIERLGAGGGGEVYKLEDLELKRTVAAKVMRVDSPLRQGITEFVQEARSMALFEDARIARLFEFRADAEPPVLLMEYVDGFPLDRIAASLEYRQRAKLMIDVAGAVHHAHRLGIQHRDLKPQNILVDAELRPRILDFGLSSGERDRGHGLGTPAYMAAEQLDPTQPIDERTDVYALGVMLYEILCGRRPFEAQDREGWIEIIRQGEPRLPAEIRPDVPEPLQAIALKAIERDPANRYSGADELATDLQRWLDGAPVTARPTIYRGALRRRVQPHLEQIREWRRLRLIWPHEERQLLSQYDKLEATESEWFLRSRALGLSQISLYLGALLTLAGGLFYFASYVSESVDGLLGPLLFLALPFVALNLAARRFGRDGRESLAVAFHLAALVLLPLFLLIMMQELHWWRPRGDADELFSDLISNMQLRVAFTAAFCWAFYVANTTRTMTLSAYANMFAFVLYISLVTEFGLARWLAEDRLDRFGVSLLPFVALLAVSAWQLSRRGRGWYARPTYVAAAVVMILALEMTALDGRAFTAIGISIEPLLWNGEGDAVFLATTLAMAIFGLFFYVVGRLIDRLPDSALRPSAWLVATIAPFSILQPVGAIALSGDYPRRFSWIYLFLALAIAFLSRLHQRKAFYYAGLFNTALALLFITDQYGWWDRPHWALVVLAAGFVVLIAGVWFHHLESRRR